MAVAQLAGVVESQVTILPLPAAPKGVAASLTLATPLPAVADRHDVVTNGGRNNLRRLTGTAAGSDAVEVRCSISTGSAKEAADVTRNIGNPARQARFARQLADSGLQLVPGSLSLLAADGTTKVTATSSSSSAGGRAGVGIASTVVMSVGAVLLAAFAA
jgi:hypothetical protein